MNRMKARFVVIGYGWRADFFYRLARMLPNQFEITAGVLRTRERAAQAAEEYSVFATDNLEEALETKPDFVVLCVPRGIVKDYLIRLMKVGYPVLCETPPAKNVREMEELWEAKAAYNGKVQVVEQYFLQPYYAGLLQIIDQGYLGEVSGVMLSALHGYHAVSMFRKFLGVGFENCRIQGQRFTADVTATNSRSGFEYDGRVIQADRDWVSMAFEQGKTAFLDFSGEQYFSPIRTRRLNIQGVRGEINDMTVRYLNRENVAVTQEIQRNDIGVYNNMEWSHKGMMFLDREIYTNPYYPARLNDDEIAVASCLTNMKEFVETGKEFYSLKEALQDTYLSFAMEEAIEKKQMVETSRQIWAD